MEWAACFLAGNDGMAQNFGAIGLTIVFMICILRWTNVSWIRVPYENFVKY